MKIQVVINEENVIPYLVDIAKTQIWHINDTIQRLRENYTNEDRPDFLFKDLRDLFATLEATNKMLQYHGADPVEVFCTHVKIGYDLDNTPFNGT